MCCAVTSFSLQLQFSVPFPFRFFFFCHIFVFDFTFSFSLRFAHPMAFYHLLIQQIWIILIEDMLGFFDWLCKLAIDSSAQPFKLFQCEYIMYRFLGEVKKINPIPWQQRPPRPSHIFFSERRKCRHRCFLTSNNDFPYWFVTHV